MIGQNQRQQRLGNWHCADAYAGVVATQSLHGHGITRTVDRAALNADAGGGFERQRYGDVLTAGNAAQNATGVVAQKAVRCDFVAVFGTTPIATPLTAFKPIIACAMSASSRS